MVNLKLEAMLLLKNYIKDIIYYRYMMDEKFMKRINQLEIKKDDIGNNSYECQKE